MSIDEDIEAHCYHAGKYHYKTNITNKEDLKNNAPYTAFCCLRAEKCIYYKTVKSKEYCTLGAYK